MPKDSENWFDDIAYKVKELRGVLAILLISFLLGAVTVSYLNIPERVTTNERNIIANQNRIDLNANNFQTFVNRFDRWLCIQEAESSGASAEHCSL